MFKSVRQLFEFHFAFVGAEQGFVTFGEPEFLFFEARENYGHCFFVERFHEIVWLGRKGRERISRLVAFEITAPQSGESVRNAAFHKYLHRREPFSFDGPFVKTVEREKTALAFAKKIGPQFFVVHRLNSRIERREFRLEFFRSVPLTPPTSLKSFN